MPAQPLDPSEPTSPGSTAGLRTANQRRIVQVLQERVDPERPVTQADLARATGLAPATVSNIVRDLASTGLVDTVAGSGRRGTAVRISRRAGLVAGVEFGHTHLRVAVADLGGQVLAEESRPVAADQSSEDGLALAETLLDSELALLDATRDDVHTIGLGLPAPIPTDGVVSSPAILPGWIGVHAAAVAAERFGRPVHVDNDANLGALAEYRRGAGRGHPCLLFVKISSGLGSGVIVDGQIFRGAHGTAGELGHFALDDRGPICRCGNRGCIEAYVSVGHVLAQLAGQLPGASFDEVVEVARAGHDPALRVFEDVGHHLGWALGLVANLLNPGVVVIGGEMSRAGDILLEPTRVGLRRHALSSVVAETRLVTAVLGERASLVGALLLALDRTEIGLSGSAT
jgi:predicted NBD/HSP70 family sugar kinase